MKNGYEAMATRVSGRRLYFFDVCLMGYALLYIGLCIALAQVPMGAAVLKPW